MSKFKSDLPQKPKYIFKAGDCVFCKGDDAFAVVVRTECDPGGVRGMLDVWFGKLNTKSNDTDIEWRAMTIECLAESQCEKVETPLPLL